MKLSTFFLAANLGLALSASAEMLYLNYAGSFGPTTTLGGVPLGAETPFSLQAGFESTANIFPDTNALGVGFFSVTSFSISLLNTNYTAAPAPTLNIGLGNPVAPNGIYYAAGIQDTGDSGFLSLFTVATPPFSATAPTPSVLSDFTTTLDLIQAPLIIALDGGVGSLNIKDFGRTSPFTAELTGVPESEPGPWAMTGVTLLGAAGVGLRQRRSRQAK